jgi:septum formation protein
MNARIILASGSPRRRQMLKIIGLPFEVSIPRVGEEPLQHEAPVEFARRLALSKAAAVAASGCNLPILAADTVVASRDAILGKPRSKEDAFNMLRRLAGSSHQVHTAMALSVGNNRNVLVDTAVVDFKPMTDVEIQWYVDTDEPMDKAGAYGVQGIGGLFVDSVTGSPHTVVGLPIHRMAELFELCDLDLWQYVTHRDTLDRQTP